MPATSNSSSSHPSYNTSSYLKTAYINTMHMPPSGSFKYIVQARCSLSYYPEFKMLRAKTARTLGDWIYEDILCRWGSLEKVVTDNGPAFLKVMDYPSRWYHLNHICISGYNSWADRLVKQSHFDIFQSHWWRPKVMVSRIIFSVLGGKSNVSKKNEMLTIFCYHRNSSNPSIGHNRSNLSPAPTNFNSLIDWPYCSMHNSSAKEVNWHREIILKSLPSLTQSSTSIQAEASLHP
jgi:hypothetical protein